MPTPPSNVTDAVVDPLASVIFLNVTNGVDPNVVSSRLLEVSNFK